MAEAGVRVKINSRCNYGIINLNRAVSTYSKRKTEELSFITKIKGSSTLCFNFNNKCKEVCQFFKKHGYPDSAVTTGKHCAQEIDRETAL